MTGRGEATMLKQIAAAFALAAAAAAPASAGAAAPGPFGLPPGQIAEHPCRASYQGRPLFAGRCQVNTRGRETMVFSPRDGCTFTLRPSPGGFTGELSAYRNSCALDAFADQELEDTAQLGAMRRAGACLAGGEARVCVTP